MAVHQPFVTAAALVVSLTAPLQVAGAGQNATLAVHVENHAHMPLDDLDNVKTEVEHVFRAAGVAVAWLEPMRNPIGTVTADGRRHVALAIINIQTPFDGAVQDTADVLGRAAPAYARAWVFLNRVNAIAQGRPVDANLLVARAIAHEIGHLLLPADTPHATVGIMRASLDLNPVGLSRFTNDQAKAIRNETAYAKGPAPSPRP